jgi:hypothetical protein
MRGQIEVIARWGSRSADIAEETGLCGLCDDIELFYNQRRRT